MRTTQDTRVLLAAALHGALVVALACLGAAGVVVTLVLALALAWGANTVAHIHLHTPLFRARAANRALSLYLGALLGFPQSLWRVRHLRHHAGHASRVPRPASSVIAVELALIVASFALMLALVPAFALGAWLPALGAGLALCALQGRMEHARGEVLGISCHARLHNLVWFNDGFHVEHHRWPGLHWSELPARRIHDAPISRHGPWARAALAPVAATRGALRSIVPSLLDALERAVLRASWLQRMIVHVHLRATRRVLPARPERVRIVGGGLFPRSVRVMRALVPEASLEVIDANAEHIACARSRCGDAAIAWRCATWSPERDAGDVDLVVVPLAYRAPDGRRGLFAPGPSARLVHAWLWTRTRHPSAVVAWWLLKRVVYVPPV